MSSAKCPNCETRIFIGTYSEEGDLFLCHGCDLELELVWVDPPELAFFWDYEDDDTMIYDDVDVDVG